MSIEDGQGKMPGKLITVEGLDGSGKSTQIGLVKRWLELEGYKVFFTEWNSSPLVESATKAAKKRQMLSPTTFALIHGTDFADRYERQIVPLLHAGYLVLSDQVHIHGVCERHGAGMRPGLDPAHVPLCASAGLDALVQGAGECFACESRWPKSQLELL